MTLKVGDKVMRMLGGPKGVPHELWVTSITDTEIYCGAWTFDRATGVEIDEDLGWGPKHGVTGSYLILDPTREKA